jgi:hypothetical protein
MALTIEERKAVATMGKLADALNNFSKVSQGATRRVYDQALLTNENYIADFINKRQEEVGAIISIDYIERLEPAAVNTARRIVYHYDKPKED